MTPDLALLRREAENVRRLWDVGFWRSMTPVETPADANPGAVAERCIALIEALESRRFLLFEHDQYYPSGGTADKVGVFASLDAARAAAVGHNSDDVYILDVLTGEETPVQWDERFPEAAARLRATK